MAIRAACHSARRTAYASASHKIGAATHPDVAVECLWDCEAQTRHVAAVHVDRRVRLATQRLHELAADDLQAASVRAAAAERLRE